MHRLLYLNGNLTVGFMGEGERREREEGDGGGRRRRETEEGEVGMGPQVLQHEYPYAISPPRYFIPTPAAPGHAVMLWPLSLAAPLLLSVGCLTPSTLPHFLGASITNGWYHVEFSNRSMTWPDWTMKVLNQYMHFLHLAATFHPPSPLPAMYRC